MSNSRSQHFSHFCPILSSRHCRVSDFTWKSRTYFRLIFKWHMNVWNFFFFFCLWVFNCFCNICWKDYSSFTTLPLHFCQQLSIHAWVYFWTFYFFLLIYLLFLAYNTSMIFWILWFFNISWNHMVVVIHCCSFLELFGYSMFLCFSISVLNWLVNF